MNRLPDVCKDDTVDGHGAGGPAVLCGGQKPSTASAKRRISAILIGLAAALSPALVLAEDQLVAASAINALFDRWKSTDGPGCAVSVTQGQRVVFTGAYGSAIVEGAVANTATTSFHIASVSKQFTAFAIYLLRAEGRLSLKDDVRKYVPELHDFGMPITLDDLLHHRSGLRDQWSLLALAGRRLEDTILQEDVIRVIFRQRDLNFPPGSGFAYSNTNYTLLALVVERVSGQPFSQFLKQRVFQPLGMVDSWVQDDFRIVRTGHAQPYAPVGGGYQRRSLPYSTYGATGVQTSVTDMARWAMNFDAPKVGTRAIFDAMITVQPDATGNVRRYASGFEIGRYRGTATIEHSGTDPGYVADFLMLPERHLAITVLCNSEGLNPVELARRIADLYLTDAPETATDIKRQAVPLGEKQLASFVGTYKEEPGVLFAVSLRNGKLVLQDKDELTAFGPRDFFLRNAPVTFSFPDAATLVIHEPDHDRIARRIAATDVPDVTQAQMLDYVGDYYSPELRLPYTVAIRNGALWLSDAFGETMVRQPAKFLREPDAFVTQSVAGALQFHRDGQGSIIGFALSNGRVMNLKFIKIDKPLPS
ncbi:serine hydrolase domain-containing protein [Roseateles cellulosilyticus]|uniref:Beta-lactamase family protein n=1 Tax=Pelomonas cellulosilytica TaxID=2906762 RepID=A0ABS8Y1G5_9BURK|nr:serine hydrolase domain-containing protein [Pelomonas sp. P8]MCE4557855.1 beta-lactamase family protein [Pelomonas sp. P8]